MALSLTYPGILNTQWLAVNGGVGLGKNPGRFVVMCVRGCNPAPVGDLVFSSGGDTITIPKCRRVSVTPQGTRLSVTLEDTRWRWRYGIVFGHYNQPNAAGTGVINEKTPRELAALLATAMNETVNATALPNDSRPEVNWEGANPAEQLEQLASSLGCAIAPALDGTWKLVTLGSGSGITNAALKQDATGTVLPTIPDQIAVVGGPVQYEVVFQLQAVGRDTDGSIQPLASLSYEPADGWEKETPEFLGVTGTYTSPEGETLNKRDLARQSVWRMYRVWEMPAGTGDNFLNPPGYTGDDVEDLDQLLPIKPITNDAQTLGGGVRDRRRVAEVWGTYFDKALDGSNVKDGTRVRTGWTLDAEKGILTFAEPLYRNTTSGRLQAALFLRCVVEVTSPAIYQRFFYAKYRNTGASNGTGAETVLRPDLLLRYSPTWTISGTQTAVNDNKTEIDAEMDYHLDGIETQYQSATTGPMTFSGVHAFALDGIRHDISWSMNSSGAPQTVVGFNSSANPYRPSFLETQRKTRKEAEQSAGILAGRREIIEAAQQVGVA